MTEGPPLELVQDALARIGDDGELAAVTPAMAKWLGERAVTRLVQLPLGTDQFEQLQGGGAVVMIEAHGAFELQRLVHDGRAWLRVSDVGERLRAQAASDAAARARSLAQLAGSIAHDLNNQFNAAVGLSSMLSPLARDELDRESLRALDKAVVHGARLADLTARLLRRTPDRRATTTAAAVLADVMTMVKKALDVAEVVRESEPLPPDLELRVAHDNAVHAVMVGVMALLEGRPSALRIGAFADRRAVGDGRERDVVVVRFEAPRLPEDFCTMFKRLCVAAPGALGLGAGRDAFAGVVGVVASQRRSGGDLLAQARGEGLCLEWVWPRARR